MLILVIRTDNPLAEVGLYHGKKRLTYETWEAHRELSSTIHLKIKKLLDSQKLTLDSLSGVIVFKGPGSFTGLRIGISVANALAFSLNIPIVSSMTGDWINLGIDRILKQENEIVALPEYGRDPHITKQIH